MADNGITSEVLLAHMQNMQRVLMEQMQSMQKTMATLATKDALAALDIKVQALDAKVDRHDNNFMRQMDAVDDRLSAVAVEQLPRRVSKLEEVVGIAQ